MKRNTSVTGGVVNATMMAVTIPGLLSFCLKLCCMKNIMRMLVLGTLVFIIEEVVVQNQFLCILAEMYDYPED